MFRQAAKTNFGAALILVVLGLLMVSRIPSLNATPSSASNCTTAALSQGNQEVLASIDQKLANTTASPVVASYAAAIYSISFNSIFFLGHWDSNCVVSLQNVGVAYTLRAENGSEYTLEMIENPAATTVLNTFIYHGSMHTTENSENYVGYEYFEAHGFSFNSADWYVPEIEGPGYSGGSPGYNLCDSPDYDYECEFSFWVGETDAAAYHAGYIAQAGTDSYCQDECSDYTYGYYQMWYEFYPGTPTLCYDVSEGDHVSAQVNPIGDNEYEASIYDYASQQTCGGDSSSSYGLGVAHYSDFMGERPSYASGGYYYGLPQFSELSVFSGLYEDTSDNEYSIGSGYAYIDVMNQSTSTYSCQGSTYYWNVCPSVPSGGDFTELYETSQGE